jgi:phage-related protein
VKILSFINTDFSFNGTWASDMGVSLISIDRGWLKRKFGVKKSINKEKIRDRDIPIYYNSEKQTDTISITIAKINIGDTVYEQEEWEQIAQWLFAEGYHEFISEDYPDRILYLQFIEGEFNDNWKNEGYIELQADSLFPYYLTPVQTRTFDLSSNNSSSVVKYYNPSNVDRFYKPLIKIETMSKTIKIKNIDINNEETIFSDLTIGEIITIDSETLQIQSDTGNERISNFNFVYPRLTQGLNRLEITGKCKITITSQFPIIM